MISRQLFLLKKSLHSDIEKMISIPTRLKDRLISIPSEEETRLRAKTKMSYR